MSKVFCPSNYKRYEKMVIQDQRPNSTANIPLNISNPFIGQALTNYTHLGNVLISVAGNK
jgi:hypothetical protein